MIRYPDVPIDRDNQALSSKVTSPVNWYQTQSANLLQSQVMKLQGKVAVITGASMGIGEEIAKLFAQEGARLVLCSRDLARQETARQRIGAGENAISVSCDVSKRDQVEALMQTAMKKFGRI